MKILRIEMRCASGAEVAASPQSAAALLQGGPTRDNPQFGAADSLTPVSAGGFRFTGTQERPSTVGRFERSIDTVRKMPCDILLTPHTGLSGMDSKVARLREGQPNPFIDRGACREYADAAEEAFDP